MIRKARKILTAICAAVALFCFLSFPPVASARAAAESVYGVSLLFDEGQGSAETADDSASEGDTVVVSASANEGFCFLQWEENGVPVSFDSDYSFVMPARSVALTAVFAKAYKLTVVNGVNGEITVRYAAAGSFVTVTRMRAEGGFRFDRWEVSGAEPAFSFGRAEFVMPENDVSLTAVYEERSVTTTAEAGFEQKNPYSGKITAVAALSAAAAVLTAAGIAAMVLCRKKTIKRGDK